MSNQLKKKQQAANECCKLVVITKPAQITNTSLYTDTREVWP